MGDFIKAAHSKDGKQAFTITEIVRDPVAGHRTDEAGEEITDTIGVVEKYVGNLVDLKTGETIKEGFKVPVKGFESDWTEVPVEMVATKEPSEPADDHEGEQI